MKNNSYYICDLCGTKHAFNTNECVMCGWKYDHSQNTNHNLDMGLNLLSYNKYKRVYYFGIENITRDEDFMHMGKTIPKLYAQNPEKYNAISDEELENKILENKKDVEHPPYKCKLCGMGDIEEIHDICNYCGWEDDGVQHDNPDFVGGANKMSFNQYKFFWEYNKDKLIDKKSPYYAIELSQQFYDKNFKVVNDEIIKRELNGEIIQKLK